VGRKFTSSQLAVDELLAISQISKNHRLPMKKAAQKQQTIYLVFIDIFKKTATVVNISHRPKSTSHTHTRSCPVRESWALECHFSFKFLDRVSED
jgi:hypothetical protein